MDYRVEDKYLITEDVLYLLNERLKTMMEYDIHSVNSSYLVRSLYFDDLYDNAVSDNEAGVDCRAKYRIRTYNNDVNLIKLEKKTSIKGYKHKDSVIITKDIADKLVSVPFSRMCDILPNTGKALIEDAKQDNLRKIISYMVAKHMRPRVIVEYERLSFVNKMGNVRITFDKNISGTSRYDTFFDNVIPTAPVLPVGHHILEVKYDEILPGYIKELLNDSSLTKIAYSKYYQVRNNPQLNEFI